MRIYYHLSGYISHRQAGEAYRACFAASGHALVGDPVLCDLAVFHDDASNFPFHVASCALSPGVPKIGFCVWEADRLPEAYIKGLALMDRVWTPSHYSLAAILPHFPGSRVLPHVVTRRKVGREALAWARERIGSGGPGHIFYTVIDAINPRKNLAGLLEAFVRAFPGNRGAASLVVKQYRTPLDLSALPGVVSIPEDIDDEQMAALHVVCDTFVSAHHAEGWGLALSEAMSFGNPVLATGYSGNMEFMNAENSVPLPYTLAPVSPAMCAASPLFTPDMRWADVDMPALCEAMRQAAAHPANSTRKRAIQESMGRFSPAAVGAHLKKLLEEFFF